MYDLSLNSLKHFQLYCLYKKKIILLIIYLKYRKVGQIVKQPGIYFLLEGFFAHLLNLCILGSCLVFWYISAISYHLCLVSPYREGIYMVVIYLFVRITILHP